MKNIAYKALIAILFISFFSACEEKESDGLISDYLENKGILAEGNDSIYLFINDLMHYWYFWNENIPELDYMDYSDPVQLMEDFKVNQDKWSFIDKKATVTASFSLGENYGYGFYLGWDIYNNLRVIFCYNNTKAYDAGIRRGVIIEEIDNIPVLEFKNFDAFYTEDAGTMSFKFREHNGTVQTVNLSKEQYKKNAVFERFIFDVSGTKTGYLAYQSFLEYSETELNNAFTYFNSEDIEELIIDLRYNGGGHVHIAQKMANILVPPAKNNDVFFSTKHNKINSLEYDETTFFANNSLNLDLKRVFFITNEFSASASELVINGLDPHMDVLQIGEPTAGKPYAMYGFEFQEWLAYPVTAKSVNANGYGDYENGINPDKYVADYLDYDWGDPNDPAIKQAINYIHYGNFDAMSLDYKDATQKPVIINANKIFGKSLMISDK